MILKWYQRLAHKFLGYDYVIHYSRSKISDEPSYEICRVKIQNDIIYHEKFLYTMYNRPILGSNKNILKPLTFEWMQIYPSFAQVENQYYMDQISNWLEEEDIDVVYNDHYGGDKYKFGFKSKEDRTLFNLRFKDV